VNLAAVRTAVLVTLAAAGLAAGSGLASTGKHAKPKHVAAANDANLFANGSFESSLAGWSGYNATLARVTNGEAGTYAARVSVTGGADNFSIYPSPRPVSATTAATTYVASAAVRTVAAPRTVCLRIREFSSSSLVGSAQSCLTSSSAWQTFAPVTYRTAGAGDSLDAYVFVENAESGDSFDVDAISLATAGTGTTTTPTAPPPTTTTTVTTTPPPTTTVSTPPTTGGALATGIDNAHIAVTWPAVPGAASYSVARGSLAVGTTAGTSFTDALLWPQTTYGYTIRALSAGGSVLATMSASGTTTALPAGGFPRPFAPTSFWNTPISGTAQTAGNSAALVSYLAAHATSPSLSIGEWSVPVAEAHPSDPSYSVPCTMYGCTLGAFGPFRIPVTAHADPSSDGHLAVIDPSSNREWDMWQAKSSGGSWSASAGAAVSTAASGVAPAGTASGDAANFPLLGGLIRPEEIAQGHIDHALVFGLPGVGSGAPVCPATHNAGTSSDPNALREGTHVQLDPSIDVSSLPIPAYAKVVARAMQVYGMYLRDSSGALGVYAENPLGRGYNPWPAVLGIAAGNDYPSLAGIPWSRFRVIAAPDYPSC